MPSKKEEMIKLLEIELGIIEDGGYGRSVRQPREPKSMFQHSVACINHWLVPGHPPESCDGCLLLDFVPEKYKSRNVPCHLIPLTEAGDTIDSLSKAGDQENLEEVVKQWIRTTIKELQKEVRSGQGGSDRPLSY